MRTFILLLVVAIVTGGCHESMEDKAAREAREYTVRYCPTPVTNGVRTDSVAFDKASRTYTYYCSFSGKMDDEQIISQHRSEIHRQLVQEIRQATRLKAYKEAEFIFAYVCRSEKNPQKIIYSDKFTPKDYK